MKKYNFRGLIAGTLVLSSLLFLATFVEAADDAKDISANGKVQVKDSGTTPIVDPEIPTDVIDPEPGPSTKGALRIDYVSALDFGKVKLTKSKRSFNALGSKIGKTDKVRGSFIQISDFRENRTGWTLQVKQDTQFKTKDYDELSGAVLSLDRGWANSTSTSGAPTVTRDTLAINNIGEVYDVARATKNAGGGVWSIDFGASKDNDKNQPTTLKKVESDIRNSAVKLTIPDSTKVVPKEYQTKITWILSEAQ